MGGVYLWCIIWFCKFPIVWRGLLAWCVEGGRGCAIVSSLVVLNVKYGLVYFVNCLGVQKEGDYWCVCERGVYKRDVRCVA